MHGLRLLRPDRTRVHLTSGLGSGGARSADRHLHPSLLGPGDTSVVEGVAVTSLARTAVDVATTGDFAQGLTAFDGALRDAFANLSARDRSLCRMHFLDGLNVDKLGAVHLVNHA